MKERPKKVKQEQIDQVISGLLDLVTFDRTAMEQLLSDDQRLSACRQFIADDLSACIRQGTPDATHYGYNPDWQPKTLEQLLRFWSSHDPDMHISIPKQLSIPKGYVIGILPKFTYLKKRSNTDATTPGGHAQLLFEIFNKIMQQRNAHNIIIKRQDAQYWQVNTKAMRARLLLENKTPGDALVVPINMGKISTRRRIVDIENDITSHLKPWIYGVGTPIDIAHLLLADGGSLSQFNDLWLRSLWVRFRGWSDGPWRCPRFYIYDDGYLCLDHGRIDDANDYYGTVLAYSAVSKDKD